VQCGEVVKHVLLLLPLPLASDEYAETPARVD